MRVYWMAALWALSVVSWAQAPQDAEVVIRDQIQAFADGEMDTAYDLASEGIQRQFATPEGFVAMVRSQYPALYQPRYLTFNETLVVSVDRVHQEVLVVDRGGRTWQAWYSLVAVDQSWRIEGVYLRPAPQQAI